MVSYSCSIWAIEAVDTSYGAGLVNKLRRAVDFVEERTYPLSVPNDRMDRRLLETGVRSLAERVFLSEEISNTPLCHKAVWVAANS